MAEITHLLENFSSLMISDLPFNTNNDDILTHFKPYREYIIDMTFKRFTNPFAEPVVGCFLNFNSKVQADNARKALNLTKMKNKTIRVMKKESNSDDLVSNETNVYVSNVPLDISQREIYEFFLNFGDIRSIKLPEKEGKHFGYGYINYFTKDSAKKAIKSTNGCEVWGVEIKAEFFVKQTERKDSFVNKRNSIYVNNLPKNIEPEALTKIFDDCGQVVECCLVADKNGNPTAKITFETVESASKAVMTGNDKTYGNQYLTVDYFRSNSEIEMINKNKQMMKKMQFSNSNSNILIRNLPDEINESALREIFSQFGKIVSVKTIKKTESGKFGFESLNNTNKGFVQFSEPAEALLAIQQTDGKYLNDFKNNPKMMYVELYKTKEQRMSKPKKSEVSSNRDSIKTSTSTPRTSSASVQPLNFESSKETNSKFNRVYFNLIKGLSNQKTYLGEVLFNLIQFHPMVNGRLGIEEISKITGMILGLDDISEISDIAEDSELLRMRIEEAYALIRGKM